MEFDTQSAGKTNHIVSINPFQHSSQSQLKQTRLSQVSFKYILTIHDFSLFCAASTTWEDGETTCRDGNWNLLVTRESSGAYSTAALELSVDTRASVKFTLWSTTDAWEAWRPRLTTNLAVEAAKSDLSRTRNACTVE
mmetsp:Transcript_21479/g.32198  ORF Transcript_21479/g.32198 Transcript_21479/m.32198 type:complete len:138 (+) Transcript_21479:60-473(+)